MGPDEIAAYCDSVYVALAKKYITGEEALKLVGIALREKMRYTAEHGSLRG